MNTLYIYITYYEQVWVVSVKLNDFVVKRFDIISDAYRSIQLKFWALKTIVLVFKDYVNRT